MKIIDSNPNTSTTAASLANKEVGKKSDALYLSEGKVLTAGETWKGKQLKLMGKVGIRHERTQEYQTELRSENKRAKLAVYQELKAKYPNAIDFNAALKENNKLSGYHGMDEVSSHIQFSSDITQEDSAVLTCGEVRSLFDTAKRIHSDRIAKRNALLEKVKTKREHEAMLKSAQQEVGARNLDVTPHTAEEMQARPEPKAEKPVSYNLNPEPYVPGPKVPLFSPEERNPAPEKLSAEEARLYDGAHAQERYGVPPKLVNHARVTAFMDNYGNMVNIVKDLKEDFSRMKPERMDYVKSKLLHAAHTQAKEKSPLKQEMSRGDIKGIARDAIKDSLSHGVSWSTLQTKRMDAAAALTGEQLSVRLEVRTLVRDTLERNSMYLDQSMMGVLAKEDDLSLTSDQEKTALKATRTEVERIVSSEMRTMTSEQVADVAKVIINNMIDED